MAVEGGTEGLKDPGRLPTTLTRVVVDEDTAARSALRATRHMLEQMRTAVIAARELARMIGDTGDDDVLFKAASRWRERYGRLADPPLEVEIEEDDDEEHEPVEGAYDVREEECTTGVYLRTDGSLERRIGTLTDPGELPTLLRLAADEIDRR